MIQNVTQSTLIIGRFRVMPGAGIPAVALTEDESAAVRQFLHKDYLKEDGRTTDNPTLAEKPASPAPRPAATPTQEDKAGATNAPAATSSTSAAPRTQTRESAQDTPSVAPQPEEKAADAKAAEKSSSKTSEKSADADKAEADKSGK